MYIITENLSYDARGHLGRIQFRIFRERFPRRLSSLACTYMQEYSVCDVTLHAIADEAEKSFTKAGDCASGSTSPAASLNSPAPHHGNLSTFHLKSKPDPKFSHVAFSVSVNYSGRPWNSIFNWSCDALILVGIFAILTTETGHQRSSQAVNEAS